jgi:hypothetical protein
LWEKGNAYIILGGKPEIKKPEGKSRLSGKKILKCNLQK